MWRLKYDSGNWAYWKENWYILLGRGFEGQMVLLWQLLFPAQIFCNWRRSELLISKNLGILT